MTSSKDYEKFRILDFNREKINKVHVGRLKTSIMKNGYLSSNPVIVNKDYEILDGQHRFMACKELGLPIQYKMIDDSNEREDIIITLNNTQRKWSMSDYVNYYALKHHKEDYIRFQDLYKRMNTSPTVIISIANNGNSNGSISQKIAKGNLNFTIEDELRVINFYDRVKVIADAIKQPVSRRYIEAMYVISQKEGFKWETMIHKAKMYPTKAYRCITKEDFIVMLRDLYNYKNSVTNRIA